MQTGWGVRAVWEKIFILQPWVLCFLFSWVTYLKLEEDELEAIDVPESHVDILFIRIFVVFPIYEICVGI